MAKKQLVQGTTSHTEKVMIYNSSSGAPLSGLVYNTSGLTCYYILEGGNADVAVSLVTATLGTWSSGGFIAVDGTNMPGLYEIGIPNAALTGAKSVVVLLQGAASMQPVVIEIELTAWNNQDAVHGGMSALPNAAAAAAGGLPTVGTGAGQLEPDGSGNVYISSGTSTGQVSLSGGKVLLQSTQTGVTIPTVTTLTNPVRTTFALIKNTALNGFEFTMYDTSGNPATGLSVTLWVSLNGGNFGVSTDTCVEIGNGVYYVNLKAADTNGNTGCFRFFATGARDTLIPFITQS